MLVDFDKFKVITLSTKASVLSMILELKPMGKLDTLRAQVLDRTKVLHDPWTQTYGILATLRRF